MKDLFRNLYLTTRFFILYGIVILAFAISFAFDVIYPFAQLAFLVVSSIVVTDVILLFRKEGKLFCERSMSKVLSLGSDNTIEIELENKGNQSFFISVVDELPYQLQLRDFHIDFKLSPREKRAITYTIHPTIRGEYEFGKVNVFMSTFLRLVQRRIPFPLKKNIAVYPSIIQMKQFELKAFDKISNQVGLKRIRRIGQSSEFDQIKSYVMGDNFQSINWKASSRRNELMVNHFEDEKAQNVYSVIDKGRVMKMPFNNLSLLDYAINTSLVISNVSLKKMDRPGLITFSEKINTTIKAQHTRNQLKFILDALYREKEGLMESNYELLYTTIRKSITSRSLLILFTNFESLYGLERVMPVLRKLNKLHLLVVVFFENSEVVEYSKATAESLQDIYNKTIAQKFLSEKRQIIYALNQFGIQSILTKPQELALNTINKYLELKSRGMI
ncbi:MAG TPA: DUF58 domain-containing protein [Cytophagales bacterium]|nr:DUF58 domain-containing protein [Cytophagales bacterium]